MQKQIAQVAILRHLPRRMGFFDYQVANNIKVNIGDLVSIPFGKTKKLGVVIDLRKHSEYHGTLKNVLDVVSSQILSKKQIILAQQIASYYGTSLSMAINLFVPILPQKKQSLANSINSSIVQKQTNLALLITYNNQTDKYKTILEMAAKVIKRKQQLFILVPEKRYLENWIKLIDSNVVVWHADLKSSEKRLVWNTIVQKNDLIIIATRSGLFLPFNNLGGIIVDDAENENYKQYDQSPHFDSIEIVQWLKNLYACSLALVSSAPRLEDWFKAKHGYYLSKTVSPSLPEDRVNIINMSNEQIDSNNFPLSDNLLSKIDEYLRNHKKVFLYLNRRGSNTTVICQDCKRTLQCVKCDKVLTWHEAEKKLYCHNCGQTQLLTLPCPICRGNNITFLGIGTEKIEKILKLNFSKYSVCRIDTDTQKKLSTLNIANADILLGTALAWKYVNFSIFSLIGIVSLDAEFTVPEFRAEEFVWQKLRYLITNSNAKLFIQTYQPEAVCLKYLVKNNNIFYDHLLTQRQTFNWPPFVELLKLTTKNISSSHAELQMRKIEQIITKQIGHNKMFSLNNFYSDLHIKRSNKYVYHLLIKYRPDFNPISLWSKLPDDIIIDRQPRFILS
ncbi:MAG: primosomal protein N' [Patescibacteria group bacterium]